jgi:hypothetical protein
MTSFTIGVLIKKGVARDARRHTEEEIIDRQASRFTPDRLRNTEEEGECFFEEQSDVSSFRSEFAFKFGSTARLCCHVSRCIH